MILILDFGSGNTCKNDIYIVKDMIDSVPADSKLDIVIKWQLFRYAPPNIPLHYDTFEYAYEHALDKGLLTTASVFDLYSLHYLEMYDVPFVKIANNPIFHILSRLTSERVILSARDERFVNLILKENHIPLCCISKYPATVNTYVEQFQGESLQIGISDHTVGWELYERFRPKVLEKHYVLEHEDDNPDSCVAITPRDLEEIL